MQYAYIETNGSISVELKPQHRTITPQDLSMVTEKVSIPCLVICDGEIVDSEFDVCNMTREKLYKILDEKELSAKEILLMTVDSSGRSYIRLKEVKKP